MMFSIPSERIFSSKKHGRKKAKGDKEAQDREEDQEAQDHQATINQKPLRRKSERFLYGSSYVLHVPVFMFYASIAWCLKD